MLSCLQSLPVYFKPFSLSFILLHFLFPSFHLVSAMGTEQYNAAASADTVSPKK